MEDDVDGSWFLRYLDGKSKLVIRNTTLQDQESNIYFVFLLYKTKGIFVDLCCINCQGSSILQTQRLQTPVHCWTLPRYRFEDVLNKNPKNIMMPVYMNMYIYVNKHDYICLWFHVYIDITFMHQGPWVATNIWPTSQKFNLELENQPLKNRDSFWTPSFSGSILKSLCVSNKNYHILYTHMNELKLCFSNLGVASLLGDFTCHQLQIAPFHILLLQLFNSSTPSPQKLLVKGQVFIGYATSKWRERFEQRLKFFEISTSWIWLGKNPYGFVGLR